MFCLPLLSFNPQESASCPTTVNLAVPSWARCLHFQWGCHPVSVWSACPCAVCQTSQPQHAHTTLFALPVPQICFSSGFHLLVNNTNIPLLLRNPSLICLFSIVHIWLTYTTSCCLNLTCQLKLLSLTDINHSFSFSLFVSFPWSNSVAKLV